MPKRHRGVPRINRSVISGRANPAFIPASGPAPSGLAGCISSVPWQATSPLFQSPLGAPFGPSVGFHGLIACAFLLCPLLTSPRYSASVARCPASMLRSTGEISRGKTRYLHCIDAGFTKCTLLPQMEDFAVTCPLVPSASRLISDSCSSSRSFGLGFLQTSPHGDALALLLAFGSAYLAIGLSPTK
jgi:hypothetical protein